MTQAAAKTRNFRDPIAQLKESDGSRVQAGREGPPAACHTPSPLHHGTATPSRHTQGEPPRPCFSKKNGHTVLQSRNAGMRGNAFHRRESPRQETEGRALRAQHGSSSQGDLRERTEDKPRKPGIEEGEQSPDKPLRQGTPLRAGAGEHRAPPTHARPRLSPLDNTAPCIRFQLRGSKAGSWAWLTADSTHSTDSSNTCDALATRGDETDQTRRSHDASPLQNLGHHGTDRVARRRLRKPTLLLLRQRRATPTERRLDNRARISRPNPFRISATRAVYARLSVEAKKTRGISLPTSPVTRQRPPAETLRNPHACPPTRELPDGLANPRPQTPPSPLLICHRNSGIPTRTTYPQAEERASDKYHKITHDTTREASPAVREP